MATFDKYETDSGTRWMVRYRQPNRRSTKKRGFLTKRDAEAWWSEQAVAMVQGSFVAPSKGRVTVSDVGKRWITRRQKDPDVAESTYERDETNWRVHVEPHWGDRPLNTITAEEVTDWLWDFLEEKAVSTVHQIHGVLAGALDLAVTERRLAVNPARRVKLPKRDEVEMPFLTQEQVLALVQEASKPEIVLLLAYTGMRWGEMAGLRVKDVNIVGKRIEVMRSASKANARTVIKTPKNRESRWVSAPPQVFTALKPIVKDRPINDLVWSRPDGKPLRPPTTTHWFGGAVKRCMKADPTFPEISVHQLRHTAASLMIASGANIKVVQNQLGHKTASMTLNRYGKLYRSDLDALGVALGKMLEEAPSGHILGTIFTDHPNYTTQDDPQ
jgi:integrase